MDFEKAAIYIPQDKDWFKKLFIAGLLLISIIGGIAVMGWMIEIARRVARDDKDPLPDWSGIADYFQNGINYFLVTVVWVLPFFILTIGLNTFLLIFSDGSGALPNLPEASSILVFPLFIVGILDILAASLLSLPLIGLLGEGVSLGQAINPILSFRLLTKNFSGYMGVMILGSIGAMFFFMLGFMACGIGLFIMGPYSYAYWGHLIGQAHGRAVQDLDLREINVPLREEADLTDDEIPPAI